MISVSYLPSRLYPVLAPRNTAELGKCLARVYSKFIDVYERSNRTG
jgi:hypothetical protein